MRKIYLSGLLAMLIGIVSAQDKTMADLKKLSWLEGNWIRTNPKAGRTGFEKWIIIPDKTFRGTGATMKGSDTLFVEKLQILHRDNSLYYVADVPENQKPVYFKLTEITDKSFVCENPEHNFPKKISYVLEGNKLTATISGDGKAIEYLFEKRR